MWSYEDFLFGELRVEFIYVSSFANPYMELQFNITIRSLSSHHSMNVISEATYASVSDNELIIDTPNLLVFFMSQQIPPNTPCNIGTDYHLLGLAVPAKKNTLRGTSFRNHMQPIPGSWHNTEGG